MSLWEALFTLLPLHMISPAGAGPIFSIVYQPPRAVQITSVNNKNSITVTSTQAGNLLIAAIALNGTGTISTVKDSLNNSFTAAVNANSASIFYLPVSAAGATAVNVTYSVSPTGGQIWFMEVSGMQPTSVLDAAGTQSCATTATPNAPTVTTNYQRDLVVSTVMADQVITAVNAPFTNIAIINGNTTSYYFPTAKGTYGAVWTQSPSANACSSSAAFKSFF